MTETKTKKFVSIAALLLVVVSILSVGALWCLSKNLVAYDHSISALQMAQQQDFFEVKFFLGAVVGSLVGWADIWMTFKHEETRKKVDFRTVLTVCVLAFITLTPFELATLGYRDANYLAALTKWLPFNIAFGTAWFFGAGLMILYRFKKLFTRS